MPATHRVLILVLRSLLCGLLVVILARAFLVTSYKVSGASMRETLQDGDQILVCALPVVSKPVQIGDTVVLEVDSEVLVKRVMAGPGDSIAMQQGTVLRNGSPVVENVPPALNCADSFPTYYLRSDEYFVLGDHRRVSVDSREFGPVSETQMLGRVVLRLQGLALSTVAALERGAP